MHGLGWARSMCLLHSRTAFTQALRPCTSAISHAYSTTGSATTTENSSSDSDKGPSSSTPADSAASQASPATNAHSTAGSPAAAAHPALPSSPDTSTSSTTHNRLASSRSSSQHSPVGPQEDAQHHHHHHHHHHQHISPQQRRVLQQLLRDCLMAEAAMTQVLYGQQLVLRQRPDAAAFYDQEQQQLAAVREVLGRYHARPPLLLGVARLAGCCLGAAAAAAPRPLHAAVLGALQDTLTDEYNEHLRALREAGLSEQVPEVRSLLLRLRALQRAPEGAPPPPDLLTLQQAESLGDVGLGGLVGAAVKAAAQGALGLASKLRL